MTQQTLSELAAEWLAHAPLDLGTPPPPLRPEDCTDPASAAAAAITATWGATHEAMVRERIAHAEQFVAGILALEQHEESAAIAAAMVRERIAHAEQPVAAVVALEQHEESGE